MHDLQIMSELLQNLFLIKIYLHCLFHDCFDILSLSGNIFASIFNAWGKHIPSLCGWLDRGCKIVTFLSIKRLFKVKKYKICGNHFIYLFSSEKPSAPRNFTAGGISCDSVTLTWEAPESDGNAQITNYNIEISEAGGEFGALTNVMATIFTFKAKNLSDNQSYNFQISAQNDAGNGEVAKLGGDGIKTPKKPGK